MAFEILTTGAMPAVSAAAGTTSFSLGELPSQESEGAWTCQRVALTTPSVVTGTNLATITVRQMRAGAFVANVATMILTGVTTVAFTPVAITLAAAASNMTLLPGDELEADYVQTGAGLALPANCKIEAEIS